MANDLYIKRGKTIRGPLSESIIRSLLAQGRVKPTDLISNQKDDGWKPISDVIRSHERKRPKPPDQISPIELDQIPTQDHQSPKQRRLLPLLAVVTCAAAGMLFLFWPTGDESITGESVTGESTTQEVAQSQTVTDDQSVEASPQDNSRNSQPVDEAAESDTSSAKNDDDVRPLASIKSTPQVTRSATPGGHPEDDVPEKTRTEASGDNDPPAISAELTAFLEEHEIPLRDDIVDSLVDAQKRVETAKTGHVVIGQIQLPADTPMSDVICQTEILPGGYFVDAVKTPGIPVWFWHPACAFAEAIPQSGDQTFEWLGLTTLEADTRRATVSGIARVRRFAVPENPTLKVTYSLPFVNTLDDGARSAQEIGAKLGEASKPEAQLNADTGFFEISNLMDAMIKIEIAGDGPERVSEYVQPSMDIPIDLGIVESTANPEWNNGPLPGIDEIELAEDGKPKVDQLIRSLQVEAAKAQGSGPTSELRRLSKDLDNAFRAVERLRERNGPRSAVCVVGFVSVRGVDMRQLRASLRLTRVNLTSNYNVQTDQVDPRVFYGVVKPGSVIEVVAPGYEPIAYNVRGSNDGVEFLSISALQPSNRREHGGIKGLVDVATALKRERVGIVLAPSTGGIVNTSGQYRAPRNQVVTVSSDGQILTPMVPGKFSAKAFNFSNVTKGKYVLTMWAGQGSWARQIPLLLKPKQFQSFPPLKLHEQQQVEIEYVYKSKARDKSLAEAKSERATLTPSRKKSPVQIVTGGAGGGFGGGRFGGQTGGGPTGEIHWSATQRGSLACLIARDKGSASSLEMPGSTWRVLRLGRKDLDQYRSIEVEIGTFSNQLSEKPVLDSLTSVPLRLVPGNCYLIQQRYTFSVLVQVR